MLRFLTTIFCIFIVIQTTMAQETLSHEANMGQSEWKVILEGLPAHTQIRAFEDGFIFDGQHFQDEADWYYYNPSIETWSELDQSELQLPLVDTSNDVFNGLIIQELVPEDNMGVQIISDGQIGVYIGPDNDEIKLVNLSKNTVNSIDYYDSFYCPRLEDNREYVWYLSNQNLVVKCHQLFWLGRANIETQWMYDLIGVGPNIFPRLRSLSPNGRYWILHVTYQFNSPETWLYDLQSGTHTILGHSYDLGDITLNRADQIVWHDNKRVVVATGHSILHHNIVTGESTQFLKDELHEIDQYPAGLQQLLSLDGKWLCVRNATGEILIRNLSNIYMEEK